MKCLVVVAAGLLTGAWASPAHNGLTSEIFTTRYEGKTDEGVPMDVEVDHHQRLITYHMQDDTGLYADVETMEDYKTGFAISRVASRDSCFVRQLTMPMEESVNRLRTMSQQGVQQIMGEIEVWAEPFEDLEKLVGERLDEFCGDSPAYKLVEPDDSIERHPVAQKSMQSLANVDHKEVSDPKRLVISFFFCCLFFFFPICWTTNVTVNTGTTYIFFLFG
ncbi:unnamed protein product [Meganyctiphanes norvegica]|uniref:BRICHOS domain-containing protein n=1 Tax=Meganyctiphanes norvegica TaxID=48144 RepID=A0AAV2S0G9_MEGNR